MAIARHYDPSKNKEGAIIMGVPLRDITDDEWDNLPRHLQDTVDDKPYYRRTPPPKEATRSDSGG